MKTELIDANACHISQIHWNFLAGWQEGLMLTAEGWKPAFCPNGWKSWRLKKS